MDPLENRVMEYAWGSTTAIAELLGQASPSTRPEAELWMGAHPNAPSKIRRGGAWVSLLEVIAEDPEAELGSAVVARFGPRLPFLLKVLAAETPLSLQAHPNMDQARAGFAADEAARLPLDAPQRNYKDPSHKPELLCALGRFEALSGFRPAHETVRVLQTLGIGELARHAEALAREPNSTGLRDLYARLLASGEHDRARLVAATLEGCARHHGQRGEFARECEWVLRMGALYPNDIGVMLVLLLNLVELADREAIFLPAGHLHAYLRGVGIEIMANSDNVLRGGLTPKHVDGAELLRVLTFAESSPTPLSGRGEGGAEYVYDAPAEEFLLSRIELTSPGTFRTQRRQGPEILLCIRGGMEVRSADGRALAIPKGASVFVPAGDGPYELSGSGTTFRATVGRH